MQDREELVKGIQECDLNGGRIGNCPYKEILLLLKEDEPRLLTPDELRALPRCAIVWIEYFDGELQKSNEGIIAAFKCQDGKFVDEIMCYYDDFEKDMTPDPDGSCWRFWSAEPSDELRKATPWM